MDVGAPPTASEPAVLPSCGEPAPEPLQQLDADPISGTQLPCEDPVASPPTWLFLPERRLEADPLRVRPADVRSARAMYQRMLLPETPGDAPAGAAVSGLPAGQTVSAAATRAQLPDNGHHESDAVQLSNKAKGRGRLRRAVKAMSRTLRGQHKDKLLGRS